MSRILVTTAIPYVNGAPHVGHALELVQADALTRALRLAGHDVRSQTGTDDNALKNVLSAEADGVSTARYVARVAARFQDLGRSLGTGFDEFIRTADDRRHLAGVDKLWRACAANGDLYERVYTGLYCVGCEAFYNPDDLIDGRCPEHDTTAESVTETNWFFRLSRYTEQLLELIRSGALRITPETRRNEVVAFIEQGLKDFSVSRDAERARGWGISVPDDPGQIVYVWFDALANYITGSGYGTDDDLFRTTWTDADRRIHVIGKGITRFHAVYWPAMLLSAGLLPPTDIFVHEYLTVNSRKIGKSTGNSVAPDTIIDTYGVDALRWWFLREVARSDDTDYTTDRLVARYNQDLANTVGNLVNRVVSMIHKYRGGSVNDLRPDNERSGGTSAIAEIEGACLHFDLRSATDVAFRVATEANQAIEAAKPWNLAKQGDDDVLNSVLGRLLSDCMTLSQLLAPFVPDGAQRIRNQCSPTHGVLPKPEPLFLRIDTGT